MKLLQQAAQSFGDRKITKPAPSEVVTALLEAEKRARNDRIRYSWEQLLGNWRLYFITGTRKTRQKAGVVLGAGRYLPQWIKIQLSYSQTPLVETAEETLAGTVVNSVQLGSLQLSLTGPVKFLPQKNILAFDFTSSNHFRFYQKIDKKCLLVNSVLIELLFFDLTIA